MSKFLITYDNHAPRNYDAVYRLMASWGAVHAAGSVWFVDLDAPSAVVRNAVQTAFQLDDRVIVVELKPGSDWATNCATAAANTWLSANVTPAQRAA